MGDRLRLMMSRARYAALGAAIGAGLGGLISRNAASSGGAMGALVGAAFGETRVSIDDLVGELRRGEAEESAGMRDRLPEQLSERVPAGLARRRQAD